MRDDQNRPLIGTYLPRSVTRSSFVLLVKTACLVWTVFLVSSSPAAPLQNPKRLVNNYAVDLTPLFKWWVHHDGPRPLSSWAHVTGAIVATNNGAWVIEGKVDSPSHRETKNSENLSGNEPQKFLILNPPLDDWAEFQRLITRLAELNKQRMAVGAEENQARTRDQAITEQQKANRHNRARSRVLAAQDKQLKQTENQAKATAKPLDEEIKEIKKKLAAYPKPDRYLVDCFALDVQYDYAAMPVYDYGRPVK